ncbi:MAG: PAS domain S-box protein, partial [Verrucomicrobiales bacterium]|nr:PAS domain S-box protein [Verrucomicrobiales bacterium]
MVARGCPLFEVLAALCQLIEELSAGSLCGILLFDQASNRVEHGAAPSLPPSYNDAIHSHLVTSEAGPCGTAICLKEQVIAADIASDPRWKASDWRTLALAHGLHACWSTPIFSSDGSVLGTFAIYWREPRSPASEHHHLIEQVTHLAGIAIERRRTESALRESEERFRRMADAIPEVIWFTGLHPEKVLYVSPSFERIWGIPAEELYRNPRRWMETIHADDRELVASTFSRWTSGDQIDYHNIEYRIVQPGGEVRWIHERGVLTLDASGRPCVASGISTDITERKRAEEQLCRSQAYLAEAQRLSLTGSFGWNISTGELIWSAETFCIMGYERAVKPALELVLKRVHPSDIALVQETIDRATRDLSDFDFEHRLLMPDGTVKHVHVVARATKAKFGAVEFVGAVMDVTERVQAQEATRTAKARFEGILEIAEDAIISVDSDQRIVLFNQGAEKVFGYAQGEVIGQPLDFLLPHRFSHAHREHIEVFAKSPEVSRAMGQRREVFGVRKGGHEFPAEASISKLDLGSELVFTVILRDITERKRVAEALRASEHLARGQVEALTSTLTALSQESEPEKLLGHVLATIGQRLQAHSLGVYGMQAETGRVQLIANCEDGRLHLATPAETEASPQLELTTQYHPIWSEFFQTGTHCVIGEIQANTVRVRIAEVPDSPWHDWTSEAVVNPTTQGLIKRFHAAGITSTFAIPTFVAGTVTGLISIRFSQPRSFRPEEIELARALTHQAMLALRLIRLSQQSRQTAVMAERDRMARDIHDTLAQGFTGLIMQLEAVKGAIAQNDLADVTSRVERAGDLARLGLGEARRSVLALRPHSLQDATLCMALEDLFKRMTCGSGLQAEFHFEGDEPAIPAEWEEGLLRIAQESLT